MKMELSWPGIHTLLMNEDQLMEEQTELPEPEQLAVVNIGSGAISPDLINETTI